MKRIKNYVEFIYCECNCGKTLPKRNKNRGLNRFIQGHSNWTRFGRIKGNNNPNWKGGRIISKDGYIYVKKRDHKFANSGGYCPEHRIVYEEYYKCCLIPWAIIHHIDGDKQNNNINNLKAMKQSDHARIHNPFHSSSTVTTILP